MAIRQPADAAPRFSSSYSPLIAPLMSRPRWRASLSRRHLLANMALNKLKVRRILFHVYSMQCMSSKFPLFVVLITCFAMELKQCMMADFRCVAWIYFLISMRSLHLVHTPIHQQQQDNNNKAFSCNNNLHPRIR